MFATFSNDYWIESNRRMFDMSTNDSLISELRLISSREYIHTITRRKSMFEIISIDDFETFSSNLFYCLFFDFPSSLSNLLEQDGSDAMVTMSKSNPKQNCRSSSSMSRLILPAINTLVHSTWTSSCSHRLTPSESDSRVPLVRHCHTVVFAPLVYGGVVNCG